MAEPHDGKTLGELLQDWAALNNYGPAAASRRIGISIQLWLNLTSGQDAFIPMLRTLKKLIDRTGLDIDRVMWACVAKLKRELEAMDAAEDEERAQPVAIR